ncbi:hypothetical protein GMOD_00006454 [Pyrenophora seminiperda CCB06]|uniref:Uncharacterized protein n=1 Tax=Pyrenophora seminiperda CCB06 TaxID=1302712 RepID=A0A3M7M547_9PLEO|nr:hypothetical protein GMOD_00006454 [Pyrenophora seminiperda CCB06]
MRLLYKLAHSLLVFVLSALLVYSVYYAFALLSKDQRQQIPSLDPEEPRKPSPQEIAASMNTLWNYLDDWDEEHCKNVCEASWIACRTLTYYEF